MCMNEDGNSDEIFVQYWILDNGVRSKEFHGAYDGVMHLVVLIREGH